MKRGILAALTMLSAAAALAQPASNADLVGLWSARQEYGPQVAGTLLILPRGGALTADIAGFSMPVRQDVEITIHM